jgi:hypothetical protein
MSDMDLSWPEWVAGYFLDVFGLAEEPRPGRPVDHLAFSVNLAKGTGSVELFPPGALDVYTFYQRHHCSRSHEIEYITCLPQGADLDGYLAYAVFKLTDEEQVPLVDLNQLERKLKLSYGSFAHLPRARPLFARQYGQDLNDEDPPEGLNRVVAPPETSKAGRLTIAELLSIMKSELEGHELVSWLEGAFRQRPPHGEVEHRYYLDKFGELFLVRDHYREGKTLYKAETSREALRPHKR